MVTGPIKERGKGNQMKNTDFLFAQEMNLGEQKPRAVDYEAIIKIQEKIIKTQEETIKKERFINKLLYDRYLDVMEENGNWRFSYQKLNMKWAKAGIYARDRTAYMREYMTKKRAEGKIKHWRTYRKEKIAKKKKNELS